MRARLGLVTLLAIALLSVAAACDDPPPPKVSVAVDGGARDASPPPRPGCERTSASLATLDGDPSCVVPTANEAVARAAYKQLAVRCAVMPAVVGPGGAATFELTVVNPTKSEVMLVLEARARAAASRTDWSRISGIPEPRTQGDLAPRILLPLTTTDARGRDVDAVPTVPGAPEASPTLVAARLRPGGRLVHKAAWWAYRIPAPMPIFRDDAGHRWVPKTGAVNLTPGEYVVLGELPVFGLTREERTCSARVQVLRHAPDADDAGALSGGAGSGSSPR